MFGVVALAAALPAHATPTDSWHHYVESPSSRIVQPVAVASTSGSVSGASALVTPSGDDQTTLMYPPGGAAPVVVLDFGKEVGGFAQFDVVAATPSSALQVGYSETGVNASPSGDMVNFTNPAFGQRFEVIPIAGPGLASGTELQGGERYVAITLATPGSLTLRSAAIRFTPFLGTADALRGWFESSDDLLNRIWYAGVYTVNLNQVLPGTSPGPQGTDADLHLLLDGAKRDRSVWIGDIAMSGTTVYAALDPVYVRDSLELVGRYPATVADYLAPAVGVQAVPGPMAGVCQPYTTTPACLAYSVSYSTLFVPTLYDYFEHTGDATFLRHEWPNVTRLLAWNAQQLDGNGLLPTDANNGHDWHGGGPALTGDVTWNNLVYYQALRQAAELATRVDRTAAALYGKAANALGDAINTHLWNDSLGVYDVSDSIRGVVAQDANVFALLSGLATPSQTASILHALDTTLVTPAGMMHGYSQPTPSSLVESISPFMGGFQVLADFANGHDQQALDLIRKEWRPQIEGDPGGTVWELAFEDSKIDGSTSAAHAWSSGPTAALSMYVLGVTPSSPGFGSFTVAPHPGDLTWARGDVPTPHGPVHIDWKRADCGMDLTVGVPAGTIATAMLPGGKSFPGLQPGPHHLTTC